MKTRTLSIIALLSSALFCSCEKDYVAPPTYIADKPVATPIDDTNNNQKNPVFEYMPYFPGSEVTYENNDFQYTNVFKDSVLFQGQYWLEFNNGESGEVNKMRSNGLYTYLITKVEGIETSLRVMKENPKVGDKWTNSIPRDVNSIYIVKEIIQVNQNKTVAGINYKNVATVKTIAYYKNGGDLEQYAIFEEYFSPKFGLIYSENNNLKLKRLSY